MPILAAQYPHVTAALPAPATVRAMHEEPPIRRLTLRETRVARLVAEGLSDVEIAQRLAVTAVDVSTELATIFAKLGLRSRTELSLLAPVGPPVAPVEPRDPERGEERRNGDA